MKDSDHIYLYLSGRVRVLQRMVLPWEVIVHMAEAATPAASVFVNGGLPAPAVFFRRRGQIRMGSWKRQRPGCLKRCLWVKAGLW